MGGPVPSCSSVGPQGVFHERNFEECLEPLVSSPGSER